MTTRVRCWWIFFWWLPCANVCHQCQHISNDKSPAQILWWWSIRQIWWWWWPVISARCISGNQPSTLESDQSKTSPSAFVILATSQQSWSQNERISPFNKHNKDATWYNMVREIQTSDQSNTSDENQEAWRTEASCASTSLRTCTLKCCFQFHLQSKITLSRVRPRTLQGARSILSLVAQGTQHALHWPVALQATASGKRRQVLSVSVLASIVSMSSCVPSMCPVAWSNDTWYNLIIRSKQLNAWAPQAWLSPTLSVIPLNLSLQRRPHITDPVGVASLATLWCNATAVAWAPDVGFEKCHWLGSKVYTAPPGLYNLDYK